MSQRFIKFIPGEEAEYITSKPMVAALFMLIAMRARRTSGHPDGLQVGECIVGDYKSFGATRQQYRTALNILVLRKHIEIIENNRNRKKSTNGTTTVGTKVKVLTSTVWDLNLEDENQCINQWPTNDQPMTNQWFQGALIRNKNDKNDKNEKEVISSVEIDPKNEVTISEPDGSMVADAPEQKVLKPSPQKKKDFGSDVKDLAADMLRDLVEANENYRPPGDLVPFMTQIRLMLEKDHYEHATVLEVLAYALSDNVIRGDFPGWYSIIYSKNPAMTLRKHFAKLSAASNCREKRRFAASSNQKRAMECMEEMNRRAL